MNKINGHIDNIEEYEGLSIVTVLVSGNIELKAIVIETPESASYLRNGNEITMIFKETEVIISTHEQPKVSLQNKIPAIVKRIDKGKLLSRLNLATSAGNIVSIISTNAVNQLGIEEGKSVIAMIKLNEVMLSEI